MTTDLRDPDVLVVGGGNAGLCAAISARQAGAEVLVLEAAPIEFRGGNTRHTRNMRVAHEEATATLTGPYEEEEFWDDLIRVTQGDTDETLARLMIGESKTILDWLGALGVRFQPALSGTLGLSRTNAFFLGGGKAMLNALYRSAARLGVRFAYDAELIALEIDGGSFRSADVRVGGALSKIRAKSLIAACGGYEANIGWLKQHWGDAADNFVIRGSPYNRGTVLRELLDHGVQPIGAADQCHAVAVDARAPRYDGGIVSRLDCIVGSIVVNRSAERFYDEGEDVWPKRYAIWGRLIAAEPGQIAYVIFDAASHGRFMPTPYPPLRAESIAELAAVLGLDATALESTVRLFNESVQAGTLDYAVLDDCRTIGLSPPKSHWASRIDRPPYFAYPARPGITFTYLSTRVDCSGRMIFTDGQASANMFAAGEIMSGNILRRGYPAGTGMTIGSVFGRIAGREAASNV